MNEIIDINKLRKIELDMLLEVDRISKLIGCKYFMLGGTLLGAVRHKGFIPWDDDIDIGMCREDYNLFINKAQRYLPDYYFLQNKHTDKEFILGFSKIRDSRTTFIETSTSKMNINHGVFIDIFPIDYYNQRESKINTFKRVLINCSLLSRFNIPTPSIKNRILNIIGRFIYHNSFRALQTLEKLNTAVPISSKRTNYYGAWGTKEIVDSNIFSSIKNYIFEGYNIPGPEDYDTYLKHIYGNYMELPPVEKRVSHHYTKYIDLDSSYVHYTKTDIDR